MQRAGSQPLAPRPSRQSYSIVCSTSGGHGTDWTGRGPQRGGKELDPEHVDEHSKIRIALCAAGEIWGGVEQFIETTAEELRRRRMAFVVVLLYEGQLARRLRASGLPVEVIRKIGRYDPTAIFRIARILRRHQVHVIHVHGYKATILGGIAGKLAGISVVKTEHGRVEPFGGWAQFKIKMYMLLDEACSRTFLDSVVFVSRDIQVGVADRYRRIPQTVIYNAIHPISDSAPREPLIRLGPGEAFRIGIIGRLKPIKGHEVLLRALGRIAHRTSLRLYIIGDGPTEETLRCLCRECAIEDQVELLGFRENIHDYMRQLDALAVPSFHEGIPFVALEAMSLRVPIIASKVGGLREILEDEVDALLVPPGDVDALGRAIERLANDPDLRRRLIRNAQSKLEARFLAPGMVDQYLAVYRQAAARS